MAQTEGEKVDEKGVQQFLATMSDRQKSLREASSSLPFDDEKSSLAQEVKPAGLVYAIPDTLILNLMFFLNCLTGVLFRWESQEVSYSIS